MVYSLLSVIAPMLFGAQIILTLVLIKGDICPGQRGRIHKILPAIGVLWLAVASLKIEAFMVVFAIFYFYSNVQTKKTRDEGPLWVLYLVNGLSLAYTGILITEAPNWSASLSIFLIIPLLGSMFAHLLLTIARTRLDAFHRILPVIGILSAMGTTLCVVPYAYALDDQQLSQFIFPLLASFSLLVAGIMVWSWHIVSSKKAEKGQLTIATLLMLAAASGFHALYLMYQRREYQTLERNHFSCSNSRLILISGFCTKELVMDLSNVNNLDSIILLGIVNEKLRLECDSLDELVSTYEMNAADVVGKLDNVGFKYDPLTNQFKSSGRQNFKPS